MRLFGSVTYDWHGETQTAHASPPDQRAPDVIIDLDMRWVGVGRLRGGTQLVAWESIKSITGWSPVSAKGNG